MIPSVAAVVKARLPGSSYELVPIAEEDGWLGTPTTAEVRPSRGFGGSTESLSWLPNEQTAKACQSLVAPPKWKSAQVSSPVPPCGPSASRSRPTTLSGSSSQDG